MASYLTNLGKDAVLKGHSSDGAFARLAAALRLYTTDSTPAVDGSGFVEVPTGLGYPAGGIAIDTTQWTLESFSGKRRIRLNSLSFIATGGSLDNIAGAYITDAQGNVLAWFEHGVPITILNNDTFTVDAVTVTVL